MLKHRIAVTIAAMLVTVTGGFAQEYADIRLPNQLIARIRAVGPYGSLQQREAATYQRITNALSNELHNVFNRDVGGAKLTVNQQNGIWTLSIGNQMLIQAFPEDAAGAGMTTRQLIEQWRANYAQQLPRAVSPLRVPAWWAEANPEAVGGGEKRMHDLPSHDAVLVREIAELLDAAREMPTARFQELERVMEREMLWRIWSYRNPDCGPAPLDQHIRCRSVLKRAHGLSDEQYANEKWWLAGETIKVVRAALKVPDGVGPVPEQRDLPDFEALPEPAVAEPVPDPLPATEPEPVTEAEPVAEPASGGEPEPVTIAPGMPIQIAAMGTGLGDASHLVNMGQRFSAPIHELLVYLQVAEAPAGTVLGVQLRSEEGIMAQRRIPVNGDRRLAVTFRAGTVLQLDPGDYEFTITLNGEHAARIPFQVHADAGTMTVN